MRLFVSRFVCSRWSYVASLAELLLGRELDEAECRQTRQAIVLN